MEGILHMCKSAQRRPSSLTEWPCKKESSEGIHQDNYGYSEGVKSCCPGCLPVKALRESGNEKSYCWRKLLKSQPELTQSHVGDSKVNWKKVLQSDETTIELLGPHVALCLADAKLCTSPQTHHLTVKSGGGSIMLWGCFSTAGPGRLI